MRLYFMELKTKGTHGVCQTSTDDFLRIEGKMNARCF